MTNSGHHEPSPADAVVDSDELRARRDQFLADSAAEYEDDTVDAEEIAALLAEARRRH